MSMGFNTAMLILNDGVGEIERNPEKFVEEIVAHLHRGGSFGIGNHMNCVYLHNSSHADNTQLIIIGGNHSTRVLSQYVKDGNHHHTEEGQVAVLKAWADKLGYEVRKKIVRRRRV